jgi:NAD(P)-dependent dehydrogenase (short-subunit alcohol dehydrogenase family)
MTSTVGANTRTQIASVIVEAERVLGPIDVLINNAGAIPYQGAVETVPPRDFDRSFQLNVSGAFKCTRAVAAGMKQRRCGRIVFVSSAAGKCVRAFVHHHVLLHVLRSNRNMGLYGLLAVKVCVTWNGRGATNGDAHV